MHGTAARTLLDYPHRMSVPFPFEKEIAATLEHFHRFLEKPQAYKDRFTLGQDHEGQNEYGYYRRGKRGRDRKEVFHYRRSIRAQLAANGMDASEERVFLDAAAALYEACRETSLLHLATLVEAISRRRGDYGAFLRKYEAATLPKEHGGVLRIMRYEEAEVAGEIIAARHADQGFGTLHVYASEPGLEFGYNHVTMEDFVPIAINAGEALLFPGRKLAHFTDWEVPALLHQVRAITRGPRDTIVFFDHIDCPAVPRWYQHIPN